MKPLATLLVLLTPACVVHLHVHESREAGPKPEAAQETSDGCAVRGIVVDGQGRPIRARVAAVGAAGSVSTDTDAEGRFELSGIASDPFVLHASTNDDQVAVAPDVQDGASGVQLVVAPAAAVTLRLDGDSTSRCAVFQRDVRVEDFTLRPGVPYRVVLPAGDLRIQLYEGKEIRGQRDVRLGVGEHAEIALAGGVW